MQCEANNINAVPDEIPGVRRTMNFDFLYRPYQGGRSTVQVNLASSGQMLQRPMPFDLRSTLLRKPVA